MAPRRERSRSAWTAWRRRPAPPRRPCCARCWTRKRTRVPTRERASRRGTSSLPEEEHAPPHVDDVAVAQPARVPHREGREVEERRVRGFGRDLQRVAFLAAQQERVAAR